MVEQLDNGTYVIEPADGHCRTRVENQAELQVCPPDVLQKTPSKAGRLHVPRRTQQSESFDDNHHPGLAIEIMLPPPAEAEPEIIADATTSKSDRSIADDSGTNELPARPVRHLTRSSAGNHSNQHDLLMSVLKKKVLLH